MSVRERRTYRDGAGGVTVGIVRPALVIPLIPGSQVSDQKDHPARLLVVPSLLPLPLLPLRLLERQPPPGPLDTGCGYPSHPALKPEFSTIIGQGPTRLCSNWLDLDHSVANMP